MLTISSTRVGWRELNNCHCMSKPPASLAQAFAQVADITADALVEAEHRAHEKLPGELVVELRQLADVALLPGRRR